MAQGLCSKLKTHWTNIAHHLYLKADPPVPLPAVGPLAELLTVTRAVCHELVGLAAAGKLTAADVSIALDTNTVRLLGRLVQWLQAHPDDQLLLNSTERSESLWQLLLLTLANLLKVLQPDQDKPADAALINRFKQQLQASGLLGTEGSDSSDGSTTKAAAAAAAEPPAAPTGILAALQWLLQHHPHRCLSASMGAWMMLQELWASSSPPEPPGSNADTAAASAPAAGADNAATTPAAAAAASTATAEVPAVGQSHLLVAERLMPSLGQLLQAYVECAYCNVANPPVAPLQQGSVSTGTPARSSSGAGTPARKIASRERLDSSSGSSPSLGGAVSTPTAGPAITTPKKRSIAAHDDGSSSPVPADAKAAAEADASAVLKGYSHATCLVDDPSTAVFRHLLANLHSMQIQLVVLAAAVSASSSSSDKASGAEAGEVPGSSTALQLPHTTHLQVLSLANSWLWQHAAPTAEHAAAAGTGNGSSLTPKAGAAGPASAAAAAAGRQLQHQAFVPLPSVAVDAVKQAAMDKFEAVQQLVVLCASALQADCLEFALSKQRQQQPAVTAGDAGTSSSSSPAGETSSSSTGSSSKTSSNSSSSSTFDGAAVSKLLLEAICLQQACGAPVSEAPFDAVANAARCCTRSEVQLLLQEQGSELLRALLQYIQQQPHQHQQQREEEEQPQAADAAEDADLAAARRCVMCAQVFLDVCSSRRMGPSGLVGRTGVDDQLLGTLTETDPATFYTIMDTLVRKVHPDSLMVLLPMSACFLAHDIAATVAQQQQQQQQQQQEETGSEAGSAAAQQAASSSSSSDVAARIASSRSLVILHDPDVCRTFAAALHGYCKTALGHLMQDSAAGGAAAEGCSGCCHHDHGHEHGHSHQHTHEHGHGHAHGHEHHHHHHHHHQLNLAGMLSPLQQVAHWLMFCYDLTMTAVQDQASMQELMAADAAAASAAAASGQADSDSNKADRLLSSCNKRAQQLQSASQAAAGSLVLTVLLARAAAPLLGWMQNELKQLPAAPADTTKRNSGGGSSSSGDVTLPCGTAANIWAGLHFVRNVWQAVCARYCLSEVLEDQMRQLFRAAAKAAEASAGLNKQAAGASSSSSSSQKGSASAAEGGGTGEAAIQADRVAKGLKAAAGATNAALHGRGLARGWSHLAYVMPPGAVASARTFQDHWHGDLLELPKAMPILEAARDKLFSGQADGSNSAVVLPGPMRQELLQLFSDSHTMLRGVMDDVPLPVGCNNPSCLRMEAVAEATLSINKRCSQCLAAHYCCKDCQVQHWPAHKTACKRLRQQAPSSRA